MSKRAFNQFLFAIVAMACFCLMFAGMPGCNASPQAQIDRAEVLYGATVGETNDLYEEGVISPKTQLEVISPTRKQARKALDAAKASVKLGDPGWKILLDTANGALLELQKYRTKSTTRPSALNLPDPPPPPVQASMAAIPVALALIKLIETLAPVAGKLMRGDELTPEERALAEKHSSDADAQADVNDADAAKRV
jgi:hypothetical protein